MVDRRTQDSVRFRDENTSPVHFGHSEVEPFDLSTRFSPSLSFPAINQSQVNLGLDSGLTGWHHSTPSTLASASQVLREHNTHSPLVIQGKPLHDGQPSRRKGRPRSAPKPKAVILGPKRPVGRPRKVQGSDNAPAVKRPVGRPPKVPEAGGVVISFGKFVSTNTFSL